MVVAVVINNVVDVDAVIVVAVDCLCCRCLLLLLLLWSRGNGSGSGLKVLGSIPEKGQFLLSPYARWMYSGTSHTGRPFWPV